MLQFALAFGAGLATIASPCILPLLPALLGVGATGGERLGRWRPLLLVLGFVTAFAGAALLFAATTRVLGLSAQQLRLGGAVVMAGFGLALLWPTTGTGLAPLNRLADWGQRLAGRAGPGAAGALVLGASLGLLWSPCAGPVLASVLALVASEQDPALAAALLLAYGAGAGLPMLALAHGGQALLRQTRGLARQSGRIRRGFGVLVLASAALIAAELDAPLVAWLSDGWRPAQAQAASAGHTAPAPEFEPGARWLNGPAQRMAALRGQVVLIDFWTFGCVNCLRTLPHLKRWAERYGPDGLVVIGIHTPEFAHERGLERVQAAVERLGLRYPVLLDEQYRHWQAWGTVAWPSVYLVDRQGRVALKHVGDADYPALEREIQRLLGVDGEPAPRAAPAQPARAG